MTEGEWLSSEEPVALLAWVTGHSCDQRASDRKLRLFACACCRQVWDRLTDPRSRCAVEVAERFAEKEAGAEHERQKSWSELGTMPAPLDGMAGWCLLNPAESAVDYVVGSSNAPPPATQATLLREIFGNPFATPAIDRSWLTIDVRAIAEHAYAECDFDALAVCADALEEAGCTNEEVLQHLRGFERCPQCRGKFRTVDAEAVGKMFAEPVDYDIGQMLLNAIRAGMLASKPCPCKTGWIPLRSPHARGCFVLDLLLGKK